LSSAAPSQGRSRARAACGHMSHSHMPPQTPPWPEEAKLTICHWHRRSCRRPLRRGQHPRACAGSMRNCDNLRGGEGRGFTWRCAGGLRLTWSRSGRRAQEIGRKNTTKGRGAGGLQCGGGWRPACSRLGTVGSVLPSKRRSEEDEGRGEREQWNCTPLKFTF
jgi:hypothetical protein